MTDFFSVSYHGGVMLMPHNEFRREKKRVFCVRKELKWLTDFKSFTQFIGKRDLNYFNFAYGGENCFRNSRNFRNNVLVKLESLSPKEIISLDN